MLGLKSKWLLAIAGLALILAIISFPAGELFPQGVGAHDLTIKYPLMQPDEETLQSWLKAYQGAPVVQVSEQVAQASTTTESQDLLPLLEYIPSERSQGSCGNCWAWAGTGCLEIALNVQESIADRLSVQYLNSCKAGSYACCGGWLSYLADFYDPASGGTGQCIPWSNDNASWQDGASTCVDGASGVPCGSISPTPAYPIASIEHMAISTQEVNQATAISNIKYVLDQNKAIWFAFFVPTQGAWIDFCNFWSNGDESSVYDMDQFCGDAYERGGGHAVLCVGYNDEPGTDNDYWIMLNSWGTDGGNRPNGLFRMEMDMDYGCQYPSHGYSFFWQALDVAFDMPDRDLEYGDAPDVPYPSLLASDGACHSATNTEILGLASEGDGKDYERDARVPDQDLLDDGLISPFIAAGNPAETLAFEVTDFAAPSEDLRLNVLIDLNGDGDWRDAGEHVVQNQQVKTTGAGTEERIVVTSAFSTEGATPGQTWLRATLTRSDIENLPWDGTMEGHANKIPFNCGETEDWEITVLEEASDVDISGVTGEVACDVLPGATVSLYKYGSPVGDPATSNGDGNFILVAPYSGVYMLIASKEGFSEQSQSVVVETDSEEVNFCGEGGLIPNTPDRLYVMECVYYWQHPDFRCSLSRAAVMNVVYFWLHPLE